MIFVLYMYKFNNLCQRRNSNLIDKKLHFNILSEELSTNSRKNVTTLQYTLVGILACWRALTASRRRLWELWIGKDWETLGDIG